MDSFEIIKRLISSTAGVAADRIERSSSLAELGIGELDYTELIMAIEDEYDILIEDDKEVFNTVDELITRVVAH